MKEILILIIKEIEKIEKNVREEDTLNKISSLKNLIKEKLILKNYTELA